MTKVLQVLASLAAAAMFSGCAAASRAGDMVPGLGGDGGRSEAPRAATIGVDGDGPRIDAIAPQELQQGECGLFLWARTPDRPFVFFSKQPNNFALMRVDGKDRTFTRTGFDKLLEGRIYGEQVFQSGELTLELSFDEVEPIEGGLRVARAAISLSGVEGWRTVAPAAGLASCR